ncbi:hypothetical protein Lal_00018729 [Lupinus albus]|nr:hypothetical protein Lal_00018729 [Lupinus albus]
MFATTSNTSMSAYGSQEFYSQVELENIYGNENNDGEDDDGDGDGDEEEEEQQLRTRCRGRATEISQQQLIALPPCRRRSPSCGTSSHHRR